MSEPTRAEELACHDCREYRALWAGKLHAAEETRRLAEQKWEKLKLYGDAAIVKLEAEVERLQGELAGLREAGREAEVLLTQFDTHDDLHDSGQAILRHLRTALAPQEGAEGKGKG